MVQIDLHDGAVGGRLRVGVAGIGFPGVLAFDTSSAFTSATYPIKVSAWPSVETLTDSSDFELKLVDTPVACVALTIKSRSLHPRAAVMRPWSDSCTR